MKFDYKDYVNGNTIDFNKLEKVFPFYKSMKECPQSPLYHKEGNVWEHTKLTLNNVINHFNDNDYNNNVLFLSTLLHDVAKHLCTKEVNGELETKKHSVLGARMVREILWGKDRIWEVSWKMREEVSNMVLLHALPVRFLDKVDPDRYIHGSSQVLINKQLRALSLADSEGRICENPNDKKYALDAIELFELFCEE